MNLEICKVLESVALKTYELKGCGDKLELDRVATETIRKGLNNIEGFNATVKICEGIKDDSHFLHHNEKINNGKDWEIAVDPLEGTSNLASKNDQYDTVSVLTIAEKIFSTEIYYMNKISVGKKIADKIKISIKDPLDKTINNIKSVLDRKVKVCLMDRPRHKNIIDQLIHLDCDIELIKHCDVNYTILSALPFGGIDLFIGIGGATEGIISSGAIKCLGGYFEGQLVDDKTFLPVDNKVYNQDELCQGKTSFIATGILNGDLLSGISKFEDKSIINSLIIDNDGFSYIESYK